jgi:hypothetical protein
MKIRMGFVTNSSSSSYTCVICGECASGMDIDLRDWDMAVCVRGHEFCTSHAQKRPDVNKVLVDNIDEQIKSLENREPSSWYTPERIAQDLEEVRKHRAFVGKLISKEETRDEDGHSLSWYVSRYDADDIYAWPEECCPICTFNYVTTEMVAGYLLDQAGKTPNEIAAEIASKYKNIGSFLEANKFGTPNEKPSLVKTGYPPGRRIAACWHVAGH